MDNAPCPASPVALPLRKLWLDAELCAKIAEEESPVVGLIARMLMSQLLERAVAEARKLSDPEQDAIAAIILEELEDDRRWTAAFAAAPDKLTALANRAAEQVQAGQVRKAGFDEL